MVIINVFIPQGEGSTTSRKAYIASAMEVGRICDSRYRSRHGLLSWETMSSLRIDVSLRRFRARDSKRTQGLSSKHLLKARPTQIAWPEEFHQHFTVNGASIISESSVDKVFIRAEDIEEDEDEGDRLTSTFSYRVSGARGRHKVTVPVSIYLDVEAWEDAEVEDGEMVISPVNESAVFQVPISNSDLSVALNSIKNLIESDEKLPDGSVMPPRSPEETYARLLELLTVTDIRTPSIHAEIILRALIRNPTDYTERPDYSQDEKPSEVVLKLSPAIQGSPSLTNTLSFERIKAQLTGTDILKKFKPGLLDALFGG
jgi:hypothetical protein